MSNFDTLCQVLEEMDPVTFNQIIIEKSVRILADLSAMTGSTEDAVSLYMDFLLCAVSADGELAEEEFFIVKPVMDMISDADLTYEQGVQVFEESGLNRPEDYKATMDNIVDFLGTISQDLKDDIIMVCLMVCSIDGEICRKERDWIKQLVE